SRAAHPGWRRCSSFRYAQYLHSSRLAIRARRSATYATYHCSGTLPRVRNCLTVDVEEWFHICGVNGPLATEHWDNLPSRVVETTRDLLDLLDTCGVRATFFVLGWVAARYPLIVEEIVKAGHAVGSHGH